MDCPTATSSVPAAGATTPPFMPQFMRMLNAAAAAELTEETNEDELTLRCCCPRVRSLASAWRGSTQASHRGRIFWSTAISSARTCGWSGPSSRARWIVHGLTAPDIEVKITDGRGTQQVARPCAIIAPSSPRPTSTSTRSFRSRKNTIYEVSAFVRWEGNLRPILAVARMDWKPLGMTVCQERPGVDRGSLRVQLLRQRAGAAGVVRGRRRASFTRRRRARVIWTT